MLPCSQTKRRNHGRTKTPRSEETHPGGLGALAKPGRRPLGGSAHPARPQPRNQARGGSEAEPGSAAAPAPASLDRGPARAGSAGAEAEARREGDERPQARRPRRRGPHPSPDQPPQTRPAGRGKAHTPREGGRGGRQARGAARERRNPPRRTRSPQRGPGAAPTGQGEEWAEGPAAGGPLGPGGAFGGRRPTTPDLWRRRGPRREMTPGAAAAAQAPAREEGRHAGWAVPTNRAGRGQAIISPTPAQPGGPEGSPPYFPPLSINFRLGPQGRRG